MFQYKTASCFTYDDITLDVQHFKLVKIYFPAVDIMTFVTFPKILHCALHVNTSDFSFIIMLMTIHVKLVPLRYLDAKT
jgi:hypothetical protein